MAFLMKHDSNMLIQREFDLGGIGTLSDRLNELLELQRKEKQRYQEKEALIADTYLWMDIFSLWKNAKMSKTRDVI